MFSLWENRVQNDEVDDGKRSVSVVLSTAEKS